MKHFLILIYFTIYIFTTSFGQTDSHQKKFRQLEPDIWLGIWDKENSDKSFKIDTLSYDDIPKAIDFRGTVVEALKWSDSNGENILILTVTGNFTMEDDDSGSMIHDKSELYAYLFQKKNSDSEYLRLWRIYDFTECYGVDWFTGFTPKATTITDLDDDGIAEITIPYVSICRGGMDPGVMKMIMYEGQTKYAIRGETMIMCHSENAYGGESTPSQSLQDNKVFMSFLTKHWNSNKCEEGKYY